VLHGQPGALYQLYDIQLFFGALSYFSTWYLMAVCFVDVFIMLEAGKSYVHVCVLTGLYSAVGQSLCDDCDSSVTRC